MHKQYPIIDGHQDIAWNKLALNRDFMESAFVKRVFDHQHDQGVALVGVPEAERANIRIIFSTLWAQSNTSLYPAPGPKYTNFFEAETQIDDQLGYYTHLAKHEKISLITTASAAEEILNASQWSLGIILLIENGEAITSPYKVAYWYKRGVRIIGPAWETNRYIHSDNQDGGVSSEGVELLRAIQNHGIILDTAHMAETSFFESLNVYSGCVINTHSNCRSLVPGTRQLSDNMISAISEREGVIGLMPWNYKIVRDWSIQHQSNVTLEDFLQHILHICMVTGNTSCVGLGTSFDAGFGSESTPKEIDTIADLPLIFDILSLRGFSDEDIHKFAYGNWLRVLKNCLNDRDTIGNIS